MKGKVPRTLKCQFCLQRAKGLVKTHVQRGQLWVCTACYTIINKKRRFPYSLVMDRASLAANGYYANRKDAKRSSS